MSTELELQRVLKYLQTYGSSSKKAINEVV